MASTAKIQKLNKEGQIADNTRVDNDITAFAEKMVSIFDANRKKMTTKERDAADKQSDSILGK